MPLTPSNKIEVNLNPSEDEYAKRMLEGTLKMIDEEIRRTASRGLKSCTYHMFRYGIDRQIIQILKEHGYKVRLIHNLQSLVEFVFCLRMYEIKIYW